MCVSLLRIYYHRTVCGCVCIGRVCRCYIIIVMAHAVGMCEVDIFVTVQ
jgi:hypothetical protein